MGEVDAVVPHSIETKCFVLGVPLLPRSGDLSRTSAIDSRPSSAPVSRRNSCRFAPDVWLWEKVAA